MDGGWVVEAVVAAGAVKGYEEEGEPFYGRVVVVYRCFVMLRGVHGLTDSGI